MKSNCVDMKIGIILHPYGEKHPGGLPRMIFNWTKAMIESDEVNEYIIFLKEELNSPLNLPRKNWRVEILGGGRWWLDRLKRRTLCDVYLFNTPVLPMFYRPKGSVVISLDYPYKVQKPKNFHEFIMKYLLAFYHKRSLLAADRIVAISDAAKRDTIEFFGAPESKITTIPHGYTNICALEEQKVDLPPRFFFFAGTLKERKNVMRIIQAFGKFKQKYPSLEHKLVIAGKKTGEYYQSLVTYVNSHALDSSVFFLGHVNDNHLSYIYRRAEALVFPSLIEATGNPIIEAMYCGLPVITSNINGPAELGGNGSAILVDPSSVDDIMYGMDRVANNPEYRAALVAKGHEQVKLFSWENAASSMITLLTNVGHGV